MPHNYGLCLLLRIPFSLKHLKLLKNLLQVNLQVNADVVAGRVYLCCSCSPGFRVGRLQHLGFHLSVASGPRGLKK